MGRKEKMETGICVYFHWENGIWVTGTGNHKLKGGNGTEIQWTNYKLGKIVAGTYFAFMPHSFAVPSRKNTSLWLSFRIRNP